MNGGHAMLLALGLLAAPRAAGASPPGLPQAHPEAGLPRAAPVGARLAEEAAGAPADPGPVGLAFRRPGGPWRMATGPAGIGTRASRTAPGPVLAQRTIYREWGPSDDSIYVEIEVPGWKSEPLAAMLSAAAPGTGQLYVGERRGWVYVALEMAGWGGWWWYRRDAGRLGDQAASLAGAPEVPASGWSFERWAAASEGDPSEIASLYAADREAFYNAIASDPRYLAGWSDEETRARFGSLRTRADLRLRRSRAVAAGLWVNHLAAAVDALRAARFHNLPFGARYSLSVDGRVRHGRGSLALALERRF